MNHELGVRIKDPNHTRTLTLTLTLALALTLTLTLTQVAEHIGYPKELMQLDSASSLDEALCAVAGQDVRGGLQRLSRYGGSLSSPVLSAGTLLQQG